MKTRSFFGFGEVCAYSFAQMRTDRGKNVENAAVWTVGVRGKATCVRAEGGGSGGVFFKYAHRKHPFTENGGLRIVLTDILRPLVVGIVYGEG